MDKEAIEKERRCFGNGLMLAGVIVTGIGLALMIGHSLALPRHWQTVAVGLVLLGAGTLRWALRGQR